MYTFAIDIRLIGKQQTGSETVCFNLTKELLALDKENRYLLLTDADDPEILSVIRERLGCVSQTNVEIVTLRAKNRFVWNLIALPWFLFRQKPDTFHTQYILPAFIPRETRAVTHIHDVSFCAYPELIGFADRLFLSLFIPASIRRASVVAVPSEFTKQEVIRYYGTDPQKITVIPNALSEDFIRSHSSESALSAVRQKYGLPESYLLYVGTLQPRKNIPFLIEAYTRVRRRLSDIRLVLVGNRAGHHYDTRIDQVLERSDVKNDIIFPGFIDQADLPLVYGNARGFVYPTLYEGFGIPLLEAMSQEVPVAASDIPCLREVGAEAARYFDPGNLASCEEVLYTLCVDEEQREQLRERGRERSRSFSWHQSAQSLLSTYTSLAGMPAGER